LKRSVFLIGLCNAVLLITIPTVSAAETTWSELFTDWFLANFGIEPELYFDLDNHNVYGDKQEYTLKTSIDDIDKAFDYEVKVLSKSANINVWLEYYQEKTCQRDEFTSEPDPLNLTKDGTKTVITKVDYDCSEWVMVNKQDVALELIKSNDFTDVRVRREWGEMPKENCVDDGFYTVCEQRVDIVLNYAGREYIEYAQWLQTTTTWNGIFSNTEDTGNITLATTGSEGNPITDWPLNGNNGECYGAGTDGTNIWTLDTGDPSIFKYDMSGNYADEWALNGADVNSLSMTTDGNYIYTQDLDNVKVHRYQMDGTYVDAWSLNVSNAGSRALATDGTYIYSAERTTRLLYKYTMTGTYVNIYLLADVSNTDIRGLTTNGIYIWANDIGADEIFKYNMDGSAVTSWSSSASSRGLANYGSSIWSCDSSDTMYEYEIELPYSEGNFTSSALPSNGSEIYVDTIEWFGFDNVEVCGMATNTTDGCSWVNVTAGGNASISITNYSFVRGNLYLGSEGIYINSTWDYVVFVDEQLAPIDSTELKINASTDNNYTDDNLYAEFRLGSDSEGDAIVYNISWFVGGVWNVTYGNLTNTTALTLETFNSENTSQREEWAFSVISCDIPDYLCSGTIYSSNITIRSQPPTIPTIDIPLNNTKSGNTSIMLNCSGSTDTDLDTIYYEFYVDENNPNPPTTQVNISEYGWYNYESWSGNYWYRCRANDSTSYSPYTEPIYFQMNSARILNASLEYETTITEGDTENYYTNVTMNKWNTADITANLTYNGTEYIATRTTLSTQDDIDVYRFAVSVSIPNVDGESTMSGFWNFTLDMIDGTEERNDTYSFSQTVGTIGLFECPDATFNETQAVAMNFTFWEEINNTQRHLANNDTLQELDFNLILYTDNIIANDTLYLTGSNLSSQEYLVCISPPETTFNMNGVLEYWNSDFDRRHYYFNQHVVNNDTEKVSLYMLPSIYSTEITFKIFDADEDPLPNVFIYVEKYYVATDSYERIAMGETDSDGRDVIFLRRSDTFYRYRLKDINNNELVVTEKSAISSSETEVEIRIPVVTASEELEEFENIVSTLTWTNATYDFKLIYSNAPEDSIVCLSVKSDVNNSIRLVYEECKDAVASSINYSVGSDPGTYTASAYAIIGGVQKYLGTASSTSFLEGIIIDSARASFIQEMGATGIIMGGIVMGTMAIAGLFMGGTIGGYIMLVLGLGLMSVIGIIFMPKTTIIVIICIVGFLIYKSRS